MKIGEIVNAVGAEILCGNDQLDLEIKSACASDMMSDVLAYVKEQGMLITGLINPQVVRTAEMMDMPCILFVRGKKPDQSVIDLAKSKEIVLLCTTSVMFDTCAKLSGCGLGKKNG